MKALAICLCIISALATTLLAPPYNANKTWKNREVLEILQSNTKELEAFYKQVDKQSEARNFVRFNGKKVISHKEFAKLSYKEMHNYRTYIVLSEFYIDWVSEHNQLDGVSVGGVLSHELDSKKPKVRYFKFAQRYYSSLQALGRGKKIFSYCAAPYITSCILIGIDEKW